LNYVDGVTSAIQTQIDDKISKIADPNADRILFWDDSAGVYAYLAASTGLTISGTNMTVRSASATVTGIIEIATNAEVTTGTDTARAITPSSLTSITKLGTIVTGVWNGTAVADTYIDGAATWNAKQNALVADTDYLTPTTAGTTYQVKMGVDDNYVTDAEKTKLTNLSGTNTGDQDLSTLVPKSLYDANTMLYATTDNIPAALSIAASTFVGRKATGNISAMSATEARAILNVVDGATANSNLTATTLTLGSFVISFNDTDDSLDFEVSVG
jgi:hypothetical protein